MPRKKKGRPRKITVKTSRSHRRKAHWVRGYWMRRTKDSFRNKTHPRNKKRSPAVIKERGTRKQERKKIRMQQVKNQTKGRSGKQKTKQTVQTIFGKPRGLPKVS